MSENYYPSGKLNDTDEGACAVAVSKEGNCVRIDFGTELSWIALYKDQAMAFASMIVEKAQSL